MDPQDLGFGDRRLFTQRDDIMNWLSDNWYGRPSSPSFEALVERMFAEIGLENTHVRDAMSDPSARSPRW